MKTAKQVREFVRRRALREAETQFRYRNDPNAHWPRSYARERELAFIEVLNAFDTPHKKPLKMPHLRGMSHLKYWEKHTSQPTP